LEDQGGRGLVDDFAATSTSNACCAQPTRGCLRAEPLVPEVNFDAALTVDFLRKLFGAPGCDPSRTIEAEWMPDHHGVDALLLDDLAYRSHGGIQALPIERAMRKGYARFRFRDGETDSFLSRVDAEQPHNIAVAATAGALQ